MRIELAAYGWQGPAWSAFYPEEMPSDWRLDYYSNEFSSLVVPAVDWAGTSIDVATDWLAAAPAGFRFYWEIADADGASRLLELARQRNAGDSHLGGWMFQSGLILEHDLFAALSDCLPGAAYGQLPVSTLQAELLAAQGITLCWQEGIKLNCRGKRLRILQIRQRPDLRALRRTVEEQCAAGVEQMLILVEPDPHTLPSMRELRIFINLFNG